MSVNLANIFGWLGRLLVRVQSGEQTRRSEAYRLWPALFCDHFMPTLLSYVGAARHGAEQLMADLRGRSRLIIKGPFVLAISERALLGSYV